MKYKDGDEILSCELCGPSYMGTISHADERHRIYYIWCNECGQKHIIRESKIIKSVGSKQQQDNFTKPNIMKKISYIARQLLDKDLAVLVKVGILNENLQVEDTEFVLSFIVALNKKEMADEARKILKEKKNKKEEKDE